MMPRPAVSVIIIFLGAKVHLDEAIASVTHQNFTDWELLLIDDGSTDGSSEIAQNWTKQIPGKARYFEHPGHRNRGMSASRNLGLDEARGEYATFLDADDVWRGNPLEKQIRILDTHADLSLTYGPTFWWHSWTRRPEAASQDRVADPGLPPGTFIEPPGLLIFTLANEGFNPAGILWRRRLTHEVGGYETSFCGMYEDQVFYAKAFLQAKANLLEESWYCYRKRSDGCCAEAVRSGEYKAARRRYLSWLERYLTNEEIQHQELWSVLRQELLPYRHPVLFRLEHRLRSFRHGSPTPDSERYVPVWLADKFDSLKPGVGSLLQQWSSPVLVPSPEE